MNGSARSLGEGTVIGDCAPSGINVAFGIVLSACVLTIALYWPTSLEIANLWQDSTLLRYAHGWLVLAVTTWLIWRERVHFGAIALTPPRCGWLIVAAGSLGWVVGFNSGLLAMTMPALPLLALASIWAAGGMPLARRAAFAVLYIYFALPVWELINPLLQFLTAFVNVWLTRLIGIPVTMEGNVIHIPAGSFEIAGGCSGLHFLVVALAIATLQGEVDRDGVRSRWLLICIAGTLALVTNWLRVFIIIVAGHLTDMEHFLVKVDHYYFGWFLFAFAIALYLYLSSRVPRGDRFVPLAMPKPLGIARSRQFGALLLSVAALALGPTWLFAGVAKMESTHKTPPPALSGWSGPRLYLSDWRPVFENPDEEFLIAYYNESAGEVALYRAAYHAQRQGKELRGYSNSVLGTHYRLKESHDRMIDSSSGNIPVTEQIATGVGERDLLVWSLFIIDGDPDPMELPGQLTYGIRSLLRYPPASVVAFAAECSPDCVSAREALEAVASQALPPLLSPAKPTRADHTGTTSN